MAVLLHAVPLAGVCRKERSSPVPQVRARPEEMRCVGSKRTPEVGRDMLLAASIVKFSGPKAHGGNRTVRPRDDSVADSVRAKKPRHTLHTHTLPYGLTGLLVNTRKACRDS